MKNAYLNALRAPFLTGSVIPVIIGAVLAFKAMRILWREYLSLEGIIPAQALTIQALIAHGLLLSLAIGLGRFF